MSPKIISCCEIIFLVSIFITSCGGGSKLSLKEAEEVTLNYHGENFVPPPRGIDNLIQQIDAAKSVMLCEHCEDFDIHHPKPEIRINNLTHMAARYHRKGQTALAKNYLNFSTKLNLITL